METTAVIVEALYERVENYSKTTIELTKLKLLETTINLATTMISRISAIIVLSLSALVLNIGVSLWLGELLGKIYYGFFIVAAFYLLIGIVLHFFLLSWIRKPISELIITQALK
jgi:hypothetical protein